MSNTHKNLPDLFSDIADSIREKTGSNAPIIADNFPTEIDNIYTGVDTSDTTAVAADVLSGKDFYLADGTKTSGSIPSQAGSTITPTESEQTAVAAGKYTTGDVKVGAISSTYVGSSIARKSSTNLTASGATVTAPAGYYANNASKSISNGSATTPATTISVTPSISIDSAGKITASNSGSKSVTPTVSAGYVSSGTAGTITVSGSNTYQMTKRDSSSLSASNNTVTAPAGYYPSNATKTVGTAKSAATYNTSTSDQTIAAGYYTTGTQTIKAVTTSNISAENIKSGVTIKVGDANSAGRIKNVTGTYTGGTPPLVVEYTGHLDTINNFTINASSLTVLSGSIADLRIYNNIIIWRKTAPSSASQWDTDLICLVNNSLQLSYYSYRQTYDPNSSGNWTLTWTKTQNSMTFTLKDSGSTSIQNRFASGAVYRMVLWV